MGSAKASQCGQIQKIWRESRPNEKFTNPRKIENYIQMTFFATFQSPAMNISIHFICIYTKIIIITLPLFQNAHQICWSKIKAIHCHACHFYPNRRIYFFLHIKRLSHNLFLLPTPQRKINMTTLRSVAADEFRKVKRCQILDAVIRWHESLIMFPFQGMATSNVANDTVKNQPEIVPLMTP